MDSPAPTRGTLRTGARVRAITLLVAAAALGHPAIAQAHEGWGIVQDASGRLYVADIPANVVWRLSRGGRFEPVLRDIHTHALVVGADGRVYGTHTVGDARSVWALDATGRMAAVLSPSTTLPLDLQRFVLDAAGGIISGTPYQWSIPAERRTLYFVRRRADGAVDTLAGGQLGHADGVGTAARLRNVVGMAWDAAGRLVFSDGTLIRRWSDSGGVVTLAGPLGSERWGQGLMGVSVAPDSSIIVANFAERLVQRIRGARVDTLTRSGWFWSPTGVLAAPEGTYVLEHPRAPLGILGDLRVGPYLRLRLVTPDGRSTILARRSGERTSGTLASFLGLCCLGWVVRRATRERRSAGAPDAQPLVARQPA